MRRGVPVVAIIECCIGRRRVGDKAILYDQDVIALSAPVEKPVNRRPVGIFVSILNLTPFDEFQRLYVSSVIRHELNEINFSTVGDPAFVQAILDMPGDREHFAEVKGSRDVQDLQACAVCAPIVI